MFREPEQCRFREPLTIDEDTKTVHCTLLGEMTGLSVKEACRVEYDACKTCCQYPLPSPASINPVIASLLYRVTTEAVEGDGLSSSEIARMLQVQRYSQNYFASENDLSAYSPSSGKIVWAAGLVTAPRSKPTIHHALKSLQAAGFDEIHIFAEPDSWIPRKFRHLPVTVHGRTLGTVGNFYTSLATLSMTQPRADCYVIFQDDIEVPAGLRNWCEQEFWPHDTGLVSLCTVRAYSNDVSGWQVLRLGYHRTFGAQALVFRRDILHQFLTDGLVFQFRETHAHGDDAVLGEWATRQDIGIAYHTPSLVTHIGEESAIPGHVIGRNGDAQGVKSVEQIANWQPPNREFGKIGLVGWNTATGLGYQNRDIADHLPIERWLVPVHPEYPALPDPEISGRLDYVPVRLNRLVLRRWLGGLDWVLFVELPYLNRLPQHARELGISVACVPNWEWTSPDFDWLNYVDLMICPTLHTYRHFQDWKKRFGFTWDVIHVPWPIDSERLRFHRREVCERFLFVNGTGGSRARKLDGTLTTYSRKGMEVLSETARMLPKIPFIVYSQTNNLPPLPANMELRMPPSQNEDLYVDGDVCIQPSHWEGLGLQFLECQSAGMPLVTTDAPPMNEYNPFRTVCVTDSEIVTLCGNHPFPTQNISPHDLAETLSSIHGKKIGAASEQARRFVEQDHSWKQASQLLRERLVC